MDDSGSGGGAMTVRTEHQDHPRSWAAGELVRGLRVAAPPAEGSTPTAAVLLVRCDTREGGSEWILRATDGVGDEELLGALTARVEQLKTRLLARYEAGAEA
jgi:hypothetical protein